MTKQKKISIIIFILGLIVLAAGGALLGYKFLKKPSVRDGEYLVSVGEWQLEGDDSVIWKFTEIGKGVITTDAHASDFDFIWAIDGDVLKLETSWHYLVDNEYHYVLNQSENKLTLTENDKTYTLVKYEAPTEEIQGESEED